MNEKMNAWNNNQKEQIKNLEKITSNAVANCNIGKKIYGYCKFDLQDIKCKYRGSLTCHNDEPQYFCMRIK